MNSDLSLLVSNSPYSVPAEISDIVHQIYGRKSDARFEEVSQYESDKIHPVFPIPTTSQ